LLPIDARHARTTHPRLCAPRDHDAVRGIDVASGEVIGSIHRRHRATEFKKVPDQLDNQVPAELDVHLICDNYSTHKSPTIVKWLAAHPSSTCTSRPPIVLANQVERGFGLLTTNKNCGRGVPKSVHALEEGHPRLDQELERGSQAVRLDQDWRRHLRATSLISSSNSWRRTLVGCLIDERAQLLDLLHALLRRRRQR